MGGCAGWGVLEAPGVSVGLALVSHDVHNGNHLIYTQIISLTGHYP